MPDDSQPRRKPSSNAVFIFIIALCLVCALLLAGVAFALQNPQTEAKEFDRNKQMLIAAKILNSQGYFEILHNNEVVPASFDKQKKILVPIDKEIKPPLATADEIKEIAEIRIRPLLTNDKGDVTTFEKEKIDMAEYLSLSKKEGYAALPKKLFYAILPNNEESAKKTAEDVASDLSSIEAIVIPIAGFGLWAPIYGYLAIESNGDTVIGTTWYEHGETPGLGANITENWWQKQFFGKVVFQESSGEKNFQTAPLGIIVVKGKVRDVFGDSPRAKSAVDGMSGATITGDGVTAAYKNNLNPYRALLIKLHNKEKKE